MNLIKYYRKKPVTVEAIEFSDDPNTLSNIAAFMQAEKPLRVDYADKEKPLLYIDTLEGTMAASIGDFIIKGVKGEFYPCKPDIFEATYVRHRLTRLKFGEALEALKEGKRIAREGWNGKGMFLFLLPAGTVPTKAIHDPALREVIESEVGGETFDALGSIRMFTADKKILTGWLASQSDMLADDWVILN